MFGCKLLSIHKFVIPVKVKGASARWTDEVASRYVERWGAITTVRFLRGGAH